MVEYITTSTDGHLTTQAVNTITVTPTVALEVIPTQKHSLEAESKEAPAPAPESSSAAGADNDHTVTVTYQSEHSLAAAVADNEDDFTLTLTITKLLTVTLEGGSELVETLVATTEENQCHPTATVTETTTAYVTVYPSNQGENGNNVESSVAEEDVTVTITKTQTTLLPIEATFTGADNQVVTVTSWVPHVTEVCETKVPFTPPWAWTSPLTLPPSPYTPTTSPSPLTTPSPVPCARC